MYAFIIGDVKIFPIVYRQSFVLNKQRQTTFIAYLLYKKASGSEKLQVPCHQSFSQSQQFPEFPFKSKFCLCVWGQFLSFKITGGSHKLHNPGFDAVAPEQEKRERELHKTSLFFKERNYQLAYSDNGSNQVSQES